MRVEKNWNGESPVDIETVYIQDVNQESIADALNSIDSVSASTQPVVHVVCDGHGGDASCAKSIIGKLRSCKKPVVTEVYGYAESANATVFLAGQDRVIAKHAHVLFHPVTHGAEGPYVSTEDAAECAAGMKKYDKIFAEMLCDISGIDAADMKEIKWSRGDRTYTAREALKLGIATAIGSARMVYTIDAKHEICVDK